MCCNDDDDAATPAGADENGIPTLEELETELARLGTATERDDTADLEVLPDDLDAEVEAAFAEFAAEVPSLEQVLLLAERYPGLKISLSY